MLNTGKFGAGIDKNGLGGIVHINLSSETEIFPFCYHI
jgi:hypothetical protein